MTERPPQQRWGSAIGFKGDDFLRFGKEYFGATARRLLLFAGAGFDPRSTRLSSQVGGWAASRTRAVFIREERPAPAGPLREMADQNTARLVAAVPSSQVESLPIFDALGAAVVGGRHAALLAAGADLEGVTDVLVDLSALSVGTSFPLLAVLLSRADAAGLNLHAVVAADASLDAEIVPQPTEAATTVHGFQGDLGLDRAANAAILWLPQLARNRLPLLDRVFRELVPHDICPILPFPAHDPRAGDVLIDEYLNELDEAWGVDTRNLIHAAEDDPLDVYRTILELSDAREPVFRGDGGELSVLSPVGSKVLALGSLMAAIERHFTVLHVEAVGFSADPDRLNAYLAEQSEFAHVWLTGEPYPPSGHSPGETV